MHTHGIGFTFLLLLSLATIVGCSSDSPAAPSRTGPTEATGTGTGPASLAVQLSIDSPQGGLRAGLIEGQPPTQEGQVIVSGQIVALNGTVTEVNAMLSALRYTPPVHQPLGDVPDLSPGVPFRFENLTIDLSFEMDNTDIDPVQLFLEAEGWDPVGNRLVTAQADVVVTPADLFRVRSDCVEDETTACVFDRFRFEVETTLDSGESATGRVVARFPDGAHFSLEPDSSEPDLFVQASDECSQSGFYELLVAAASDAGFGLRVTDTNTGISKEYHHAVGSPPDAITDTTAFATCP